MTTAPASPAAAGVIVAGPVYCDLLFAGLSGLPALGEECFAERFLVSAGGSAITAIALRRLGRPVRLVARVGADAHGRLIREALAREGLDTRWLAEHCDVATPLTVVLSTPADRAFVTYLDERAVATALDDLLVEVLDEPPARHLHVAGFPLAQRHPDVVERAHAAGLTVSFDPGWDEAALAAPAVRQVALQADVLLPNRLEACRLLELADTTSAQAALATLADRRPDGVTVVKDGVAGAHGAAAGQRASATPPCVRALDPTGAGDVFDAGFLDAYLERRPLAACLERGVRSGAHATTAYGGASAAPYRADLEEDA